VGFFLREPAIRKQGDRTALHKSSIPRSSPSWTKAEACWVATTSYDDHRFSPLKQINEQTVGAWNHRTWANCPCPVPRREAPYRREFSEACRKRM